MFERNIEETIAFLHKETIEGADSITSRQIFASSMPLALKRMFEVDIDIWVREESERLLQSPHFRYDESEVQVLFEQITEKARDYGLFTAAEYHAALDKNVKLLFNYVCRPQWTLVKYLFAEREHAATDDILSALKTFWHYEYYQIILREYFEKKKLSVINVKKFTELIEHIDLEVVRNYDSRKTAHLSEPLFELFNITVVSEEALAPIEALSIFYDDKNLGSIVERLDHQKQSHELMTLHDLVLLVGDADFALGVDISTIVNEQFNQQGIMKPERNVTAGQDFDVPSLTGESEDELHHGDLGHENDALDFIISDEEEGVIVQEGDHIMRTMDEERLSQDEFTVTDFPTDGGIETAHEIAEEVSVDEYDANNEDETYTFTEESILNLETELDSTADYSRSVDSGAATTQENEDAVPDLYLNDDEIQPTPNYLMAKDEIPDISLEEFEAINFSLEDEDSTPASESVDVIDPYMTSAVIEELAGEDSVLDDVPDTKLTSGDEIDWDKEAEETIDMGDVNLDDVDRDEASISDLLPRNEDPFKQDVQLKPAEELLGLLDLDDDDSTPAVKRSRQYDIPIIEDESPLPQSLRSQNPEHEEEAPENAASTEEVIREFGDLTQLLPVADKKKYSKKLFGKNEDAFARALQVLNGKSTWRQASEYIDELFIKYDVDMYSRLAVKFTDDIYKRYAKKK